MNNESNQIANHFARVLLISGGIGIILMAIISIIVIIIYCKQNSQYNPADSQEASSHPNPFNISKNSKKKEHYEFRTLQNTSVPVVKESMLSDGRIGSLNADINQFSEKKPTDTLQTKTSQMVDEASSKKKKPLSFRSDYSDGQGDNKDLENALNKEINKYIPNLPNKK